MKKEGREEEGNSEEEEEDEEEENEDKADDGNEICRIRKRRAFDLKFSE